MPGVRLEGLAEDAGRRGGDRRAGLLRRPGRGGGGFWGVRCAGALRGLRGATGRLRRGGRGRHGHRGGGRGRGAGGAGAGGQRQEGDGGGREARTPEKIKCRHNRVRLPKQGFG
ncbi:hypothetical protein F5972_18210 [Microbispora cellulosiformans]|uniref:Uncharacterized protein n=1 Tax=Microbispora cellulosiformans TaxID=2614688 RepID=A0A5J5K2V2_9ACTN|nr:hypothetical protein F5972_18210 [Microbispora cellulosiformans]